MPVLPGRDHGLHMHVSVQTLCGAGCMRQSQAQSASGLSVLHTME